MGPDFHQLVHDFSDRSELAFSPQGSGESWEDTHRVHRARVILGIQFGQQRASHEFLRFLMEQEVLRAELDPFQGLSEELTTVAWFLSEHRVPADCDLFLRAKGANFDCHCGVDAEFVVSCGVSRLSEYLEQSGGESREKLLEFLEERKFSEELVESWRARLAARFETPWEEHDIDYRYRRLVNAGLHELADEVLDEWRAQAPDTWEELVALRYEHMKRGFYAEAAGFSRRILELHLSSDKEVAERGELTEALTLAGDFSGAMDSILDYHRDLKKIAGWWKVGYGREAARRAFLLAREDSPFAVQALQMGDAVMSKLTMCPPAIVELREEANFYCQCRKEA